MRITYIFHDCFCVEFENAVLVFDFWKRPEQMVAWGDNFETASFISSSPLEERLRKKSVYVFVSHFHKDHYNPDIFSWDKEFGNIRFIISRDVAKHARHILRGDSIYTGYHPSPESVIILRKGENWHDDTVAVSAFGSTDIGNSYVVEIEGRKIFHAGDLNAWLWLDESTKEEIRAAGDAYMNELMPIAEKYPHIDVAMFPVDARIGRGYETGAKLFLEKIAVDDFFPMHFALGDTDRQKQMFTAAALCFGNYLSSTTKRAHGLTAPGDTEIL